METNQCWCVIVPFNNTEEGRTYAVETVNEIRTRTGYEALVKKLELTDAELQ